jgi:hypothetical protein
MRAITLFAGWILGALAVVSVGGLVAGGTASASTTAVVRAAGPEAAALGDSGGGSVAACTAYAYQAIRAHIRITGVPAACRGLSPGEVSFAATTAIRMASGTGTKSAVRKRAGEASPWVNALLGPAPVSPAGPASGSSAGSSGGGGAGSRIGFSETLAKVGGLLAWLAAAASGGWILLRWWLAGGALGVRRHLRRLLHGSASAAPPGVTVAHVGLGLSGLVLWSIFMATGLVPLAWVCVFLLGPIAGLGMTVLLLGLPSPRAQAGGDGAALVAGSAAGRPAAASGLDGAAPPGNTVFTGNTVLTGNAVFTGNTVFTGNAVLASEDARGGTAVLEAGAGPPSAARRRSRGGMPVVAIAAHGVFITVAMMFIILAAIGAG